jgi:hypothetical protein
MQEDKVRVRREARPELFRQSKEHQHKERIGQGALDREADALALASSRIGGEACASEHASLLNRATASKPARAGNSLLQLQKRYGNRYVQRVLDLGRKADDKSEAPAGVEQAIQSARSGGQSMDSGVRTQMESAFGADFSGVRVHNDAGADTLSQTLNARAFTTGQDIFFRQNEYNPGSSSGRELLAHELTHVAQQAGDEIQRKLKVGQPGDKYETEADRVAQMIMQQEQGVQAQEQNEAQVHRQIEEEKEDSVQMQPEEEEEESVQMQPEDEKEEQVQMQEEEEEIQMQAEEEEEIQMQAEEEEEKLSVQTKR